MNSLSTSTASPTGDGKGCAKNQRKIFCFTHAGGSAAFFDGIEKELLELVVVKIEYPGHGARHREPLCSSLEALADDAFYEMKRRYSGGAYALFGYSMGSVVLAEVMRRIVLEKLSLPSRVFLAAHEPHTKEELNGFSPGETDDWVKARTIQFGGLPDSLLENRVFWRMYLPLYRADYSLLFRYRFEELDLKTDVPATVFYSETDTPYSEMRLWTNYFTRECEFIRYEGLHFFIQQHHSEMAEIIRDRMTKPQETEP